MKALVAQSCLTLCDPTDCPVGFFCPWNSPGKNPGMGGYLLLQGIFRTYPQESQVQMAAQLNLTKHFKIQILPNIHILF